ncbi:dockerin type I domain-containing protein [Aeoliella sp.]|uniref:dockerin type I domain-containing protein n=1 Tax=Aeoliella sp. TaxID=2795800 RepID=UPI003CCC0922
MRATTSCLFAVVLVSTLWLPTSSRAIEFNEVARFDVSFAFASDLVPDDGSVDDNPKYIGTNPLGIAWNGSKLYLAGHDNFGTSLLPIGLIEVLNPTRTGEVDLEDADFSEKFGTIFQPTGRGYTNLELQGRMLAAGYDEGSDTSNAIQLFDTANNTLLWDLSAAGITARGGAGLNFDPGFNSSSASQGVAWTAFGSGRRALLDTSDGSSTYVLSGDPLGFQWLPDTVPGGNIARDMAFDPDTGDIYVRRNNDVDAAERSGDNATTNRRTIVDDTTDAGAFKLGQKIEFIGDTEDGDLLIYNDSAIATTDQAFIDVVKVVDTDGVAQTATFNLIGGLTGADIGDSAGIYDFDYDPDSNTLAVLDFFNRNVFIFSVGTSTPSLIGDYNGDGTVNIADYAVWRNTLGATVTPFDGADGNGNGMVDAGDYTEWKTNFGQVAAVSALSATNVPEPRAALLAVVLAGLVAVSRHYK